MKMNQSPNTERDELRRPKKILAPRIYREAAKLLKKVNNGGGLRYLVFKVNHHNIKGIYSLVCKTLKNNKLLESIIEESGLHKENLNSDLTKILITELLWGKQEIKGDSKHVNEILKYEKALRKALKKTSIPAALFEDNRPRFIRINTLLITINGVIQRLVSDGWQLINTPETYKSFLECVSNMDAEQFMKDYHFDDVLVFPPKSNMHEHPFAQNGSLLLQDKASCLPALLLDPKPGSVVLDMCAAPGMKTTHIANLMKNKGTVFAVDKDPKRFEELKTMIQRNCKRHNCVALKCTDSVTLTAEDCPGVQYILVDPSCSGSGMVARNVDQGNTSTESQRIELLSHFQEHLLVHAMTAFPDVERIVYSTCSRLEAENEVVLENALSRVNNFQVVPPQLKKPWKCRGNPRFPFGSNCIVTDPNKDRTNGFFVAVLERIPGMDPSAKAEPERNFVTVDQISDSDGCEVPKKKKKAKKTKPFQDDSNSEDCNVTKKKKKARKT